MWVEDWRQSGKSAWAYAKANGLNSQNAEAQNKELSYLDKHTYIIDNISVFGGIS